jgi:hypothetical protein
VIEPARIVVTGGRGFADGALVWELLGHVATLVWRGGAALVVGEGGARGADALVRGWVARVRQEPLASVMLEHHTFPADWNRYGIAAGPRRNREMLDAVKPQVVFAFPGGRGTYDCIFAATNRKIPVLRIPQLEFVSSKDLVLCPKI